MRYFIKTLEQIIPVQQQEHNTWLKTNPFSCFTNASVLSTFDKKQTRDEQILSMLSFL